MHFALLITFALATPPVLPSAAVPLMFVSPEKGAAAAAQAEELWRDGHYDEASALLGTAYEYDPQPKYMYARALVEKDAGRCDNTVKYFEEFLAADPPEEDAKAARRAMEPCQKRLEDDAAAAALAAEADEQERKRQEEEKRQGETAGQAGDDKPVRKDVLGGVLVGVGAGVAAAGIGTLVAGLVTHGNAEDASTADDFVDGRDQGRLLTGVGIGLLAGGVAIAIAGAVRYGLLAKKKKSADVAWVPALRGTGLTVRF